VQEHGSILTVKPGAVGGWELEIGGLRIPLDSALEIGRDPACDLPIDDERASWHHLRLSTEGGEVVLLDLGSKNGTYLNGRRIDSGPTRIKSEALIQFGSTRGRLRPVAAADGEAPGRFRRVPIRGRTLRIGRAPDNDVRLEEPNVSWHHAQLRPGDPPTLVDLGSRNGTRLGEALVEGSRLLPPGAIAGIGPFSLRAERDELVVVDERGGQRLNAQGVSVSVPGKTILQPTDLSIAPGEFVALIGASGSGKTTLLKALAGVRPPSAGQVLVGTDPIELRLTEVGYVPQSDVLHDRLTVRETLLYTARLRLPSDTSQAEYGAAVEEVLGELRLGEHATTRINKLSGGQRKRVSCGVELIGKPTMLMLDEPTSGLDPPLERRLMMTLRRLAESGRGVVVVTHATSSLALCDTVAVMGEGGNLLFTGSPAEALESFNVAAYDEIYGAAELVNAPQASTPLPTSPSARPRFGGHLLSGRSLLRQSLTLVTRYARTLGRDRRTLGSLLGQAPLIGLLICLLYPGDVFALPDDQPTRSAQFVFLLVTASLWLGLIDSCREIVKERRIIVRELAVGVRIDAQLIAKSLVLFTLAAAQCVLVMAMVAVLRPLPESAGAYLELTGLLILASWSMIGLGLLVSTVARSVDQSTSMIPLLLIPQLLFGGALVAYERMGTVIKILSDLVVSRWAFAGAGNAIGMNDRLAEDPQGASLSGYGTSFFSLDPWVTATVLLGFTATTLLVAAALLAGRSQDI
jgi:ABC-type multidrug transport system ATPase subunit/pSer/pThr/pTyr-binding forkhead associated (FHA) protein/ABC-type multidrug transport system permease subunit